ncbi:unnamed protein product, partial [Mesorhabditis belari]|uniref:EGF-like domain-containing protein n=1 Tax=Mesorhabditis belari TaxID=2138241 RepID=A0AAF3EY06_9BILA
MKRHQLAVVLTLALANLAWAQQNDDEGTYHFASGPTGRAAWVVEGESLPWIGSFEYLSSEASPATVLMTVVDSSTGTPLGECSVMDADKDEWEHFVWTLTTDSLTCNVSDSSSSKVRFPLSTHPRTFSVRIQSNRGPRCLREMTVQNEKPIGCPPHLRRNAFTSAGLTCGCPYVAESTGESENGGAADPAFPIFDLQGGPAPPGVSPSQGTRTPTGTPDFAVSPCANVDCLNNGTCVVGSDGQATCLCQNGFSGSRCQLDICASVPCSNGGKCKANGSTAVCECSPHTRGILCEQIICEPSCAQGECTLVDGAPMCQCQQGFIGPNCNVIDVCIGDAACAVFGENAKCTLDSASYTTVTPKVVNASYDCHCPHPQTGQWMDCLTLVLSSTLQPNAGVGGVESSFGSQASQETRTTTLGTTTSTVKVPIVPLGAHNVVTATAHPRIITAPTTTTTTTTTTTSITPTNTVSNQNASQQMNFLPFNPNGPQLATVLPRQQVTPSSPEPSEEEEESDETTTHVQTVSPNLGFRPFPSAPVVVNGGENESTRFPTPTPFEVSEGGEEGGETAEEEENLGAGFETMTQENGPEAGPGGIQITTGASTAEEEDSEETTTQISTIAPVRNVVNNVDGLWPLPDSTISPQTTTESAEVASGETTQSVLPFWMMTTTESPKQPSTTRSTTSTTTTTTEEPETEEDEKEEEQEQQPTVLPPIRGNNNVHEHAWPTPTSPQPPTTEDTTKAVIATGNASQNGSSAASIIVAIIAVCLIGLLLLAAAFFTMRYVRQSRKLHGKYNPSREESALSAAYSLPMTHVSKEERLI